jgi:hypothetical protein
MDPIIKKNLEDINQLNQKIMEKQMEINKRNLELQGNDLISCNTCNIKFSKTRAITNKKCPHGNPYLADYRECNFCSQTCSDNHVNAMDTL